MIEKLSLPLLVISLAMVSACVDSGESPSKRYYSDTMRILSTAENFSDFVALKAHEEMLSRSDILQEDGWVTGADGREFREIVFCKSNSCGDRGFVYISSDHYLEFVALTSKEDSTVVEPVFVRADHLGGTQFEELAKLACTRNLPSSVRELGSCELASKNRS